MSNKQAEQLAKRLQAIAERAADKRHERDSFTPATAALTAGLAYITFVLVTA